MIRLLWGLILICWSCSSASGQQLQRYDSDLKFADGIYLSFKDFKNNNPIPITHLVSGFDIVSSNYIQQVLDQDTIVYYDNLLEERSITSDRIWGYAQGGKVHIGLSLNEGREVWDAAMAYPIISIGFYSYFTTTNTAVRFIAPTPGVDPYGRGGFAGDGGYYSERIPVHALLNFSNGRIVSLATGDLNGATIDDVRALIEMDNELLKEFEEQSKRQKKRSALYYIRRFNERNPIYFPVH